MFRPTPPSPTSDDARSEARTAPRPEERAAQLFAEHADQVLAYARRRSPDLAEDVVSETFLVAVRRAEEIPDGYELPWLYVVAEHALRNLQRTQRRTARTADALRPFALTEAPPSEPSLVGAGLRAIPDRERLLLTMTAFEGLTASEAADRMGLAHGSARNALVSGRRNLRAALVALGASAVILIAALVLVVTALRREPAAQVASRALQESISDAAVFHDVAVIHHGPASAARRSERYERWTDPSGGRTRVVLPSGAQVITSRGEALADAHVAPPQHAKPAPATPAVREDLAALDAASPHAIQELVTKATAARTLSAGPRIDGRTTTMVRGRTTGDNGTLRSVTAYIADDAPTVLRVTTRPLIDGRPTGTPVTVDFVAWEAVQPDDPAAPTGELLGAPPTTPPGPTDTNSGSAPTDHATTASRTNASVSDSDGAPATAGRRSAAASPVITSNAILHTRSSWTECLSGAIGRPPECYTKYPESWEELGGTHRRVTNLRKRPTASVRGQVWYVGARRHLWRLHRSGVPVEESFQEPQLAGSHGPKATRWTNVDWAEVGIPRDLAELAEEHAGDPDLVASATTDGAPALAFTTLDTLRGAPRSITVRYSPADRTPIELTIDLHSSDKRWGRIDTVRIRTLETIPAGDHADLLTAHLPRGRRTR